MIVRVVNGIFILQGFVLESNYFKDLHSKCRTRMKGKYIDILSVGNLLSINTSCKCKLDILSTTEDILSESNTYTNDTTLYVSQLEHGGSLVPVKF